MFDMKKNSGGNTGYQLCITYNKENNKFILTGYTIHEHRYSLDGAPLYFNSIEEVIANITEYKQS